MPELKQPDPLEYFKTQANKLKRVKDILFEYSDSLNEILTTDDADELYSLLDDT